MYNYYTPIPTFTPWGTGGVQISSNYTPILDSVPLTKPAPLGLTITQSVFIDLSGVSYHFFFSNNINQYDIPIVINFNTDVFESETNDIYNIDIFPVDPLSTNYDSDYYILIIFNKTPPPFNNGDIVPGDIYIFKINTTTGINVIFGRKPGIILNTNEQSLNNLFLNINNINNNYTNNNQLYYNCNNCNTSPTGCIRVPSIVIQGQTTYNGEYISDMTFTIKDKYKYYDCKNVIDYHKKCNDCSKSCNACKHYYYPYSKLKTTIFLEFGPPMQKVVKGKGCTLREKLVNYYNNHIILNAPTFDDFYEQMILYGMLKYILCKILYGDFNIHYLYRNFNKQFFKDLANSRFCGFIEFFDNPDNHIIDYDKYFICGDVKLC